MRSNALRQMPGPSDVALAFECAAEGAPAFTAMIFQSIQALYAIEELASAAQSH